MAAIKFLKSFVDPGGGVLVELPRPSALRTRLMHFPILNNNLRYQGILEFVAQVLQYDSREVL
jgi:hypothetical protein